MSLVLHTSSPLHEIQSRFTSFYPGLKIDFIFHGDEQLRFSSPHSLAFLFTPVKLLYPDCKATEIMIDEWMCIKEVEDLFENNWHLPAKIYTDCGGYWQKNGKTGTQLLKDYSSTGAIVNTADFLVYQDQ